MWPLSLGSSPRMRGTPAPAMPSSRLSGIIPAYAGNTLCVYSPAARRAGSSPRMRGTQYWRVRAVGLHGIIPAYAGNTRAASISIWSVGIIPAYAGNTSPWPRRPANTRDHPRVCGEHTIVASVRNAPQGSSPRMRGTPMMSPSSGRMLGIIPAYAGNTSFTALHASASRDHPRVCGEHNLRKHLMRHPTGSSPRMRGTLSMPVRYVLRTGIIPAYAGNTQRIAAFETGQRDHPRVCGEHSCGCDTPMNAVGSSPRMRGTPARRTCRTRSTGIIPAYAGNTRRR